MGVLATPQATPQVQATPQATPRVLATPQATPQVLATPQATPQVLATPQVFTPPLAQPLVRQCVPFLKNVTSVQLPRPQRRQTHWCTTVHCHMQQGNVRTVYIVSILRGKIGNAARLKR